MAACCPQCLDFALRADFAGSKMVDTDGLPFKPLSREETVNYGKGHFICGTPLHNELVRVVEKGVTVILLNNVWYWLTD